MKKTKPIFIGHRALPNVSQTVQGDIVNMDNDKYYKISNYDLMPPFFMNIVSNTDLWMFISSNGALTAGRRNPEYAIFPYYTDDQIHDSQEITGSKTITFVIKNEKAFLWEPFSSHYRGIYRIERNIYKNIISNRLIFEEINHDLGVSYQYAWLNCDRFGLIKRARIRNNNQEPVTIHILDGIQNILPTGVERKLQLEYSTLVDGYKKNELLSDSGLALYTLSSIPTDRAEPNESLKATTVWSTGLENPLILLSTAQIDAFRQGDELKQETDIHAKRGAYFVSAFFELADNEKKEWYFVADVNKDQSDVVALSRHLTENNDVEHQIEKEISKSSENLKQRIVHADGFQLTGDPLNDFRHCSNTLFNIMRGGVFDNGYLIDVTDFRAFVHNANKQLAAKHVEFLDNLPEQLLLHELFERIPLTNPDLERLCYEYLPLTFSRRHGDPSRPWNQFSIDIKDEHGNKTLNYQGNWRDIFQNWEALALSFPEYIENMITRFVNACTADGYNPYRLTRDGFDWEAPNPSEPWANIGYWGDHQIIYLLKLLELSVKYHPGKLKNLLTKEIFTYANVPYKIKSYQDILRNPRETIDFDDDLKKEIEKRVEEMGTDGKFIDDETGQIYHVNLTEKLLVLILVKLSNFIPEAGIWMNTQRPEWNDANNALVGYGASMVTLCYLRRFLIFIIRLLNESVLDKIKISEEVFELYTNLEAGFNIFLDLLNNSISDRDRKKITDHLGQAGSNHRIRIYEKGFCGNMKSVLTSELISFLKNALKCIDHSIQSNKRNDDLYHSYNLIDISARNEISVRNMYEMLEGQVAVLSSGYLTHDDAIILIRALRKSALYREDQFSYLLYPNRRLGRFMEKNTIPRELLERSGLLKTLLNNKDRAIIIQDDLGNVHFNSSFRNVTLLKQALQGLRIKNHQITEDEICVVLDIYETVFDHQSFTGRSGTFYKYEGLGSIYWHMVSKLLLAVQDTYYRAFDAHADRSVLAKLKISYYDIRQGIGHHKNPNLYGAFPTDPYSHTPGNSGVQQPGMTGQVKEDYISRFGELGITINEGIIRFNPALLNKSEFLTNSQTFDYLDVNDEKRSIRLNEGMLAFTVCQVPIIYSNSNKQKVIVFTRDGNKKEMEGIDINPQLSRSIFQREDRIWKIHVMVKADE